MSYDLFEFIDAVVIIKFYTCFSTIIIEMISKINDIPKSADYHSIKLKSIHLFACSNE